MTTRPWLTTFAALALSTTALTTSAAADPATETPASTVAPKFGTWGYDASGEDHSQAPGADFFRYANGTWWDHEEIPPDRIRYGNFDTLQVLSETRTRALIDAAAGGRSDDPDAARVGENFSAFMDQAKADALDAKPLAADLAAIRAERNRRDVAMTMGRGAGSFQGGVFGLDIQADEKAPNRYAVYIDTAGMGLPDRDYYLEASFAAKKAAYQKYVEAELAMIGWPSPAASAAAVVDFETEIARANWSKAEQRDVEKTFNPMGVQTLASYAPGFDYRAFLTAAGLPGTNRVIVGAKTAFPKVAKIFAAAPLDTLKAWQAFHLADAASPYLSDRFVQARFDFRDHALAGQPQIKPRWKRGVAFVNRSLGEAVGRLYVAKYFTPEAKAKMDALVRNEETALGGRIRQLTWMSDATKAKALEKLAKLTVKIGYPVKWRDYSAYSVVAGDLYGNAERSEGFEWLRRVIRLNKPVDKLEWDMTPQTVNAYYNPSNNEIVFPAAILQPPFFDADADPAVNYGGIGAVIGHEMTHGFDDQGRKVDGDGALRDWWTVEDSTKFDAQAKRLGAQYDTYEPVPGTHLKGQLTMGENIADLGGVLIARDAYRLSLHGGPAPTIAGLSGDQRLFLAYAQIWREKIRDDAARQYAVSDPHSPSHFRVDGVLRNVDGWYDAFSVKSGDAYYLAPEQRVRIW